MPSSDFSSRQRSAGFHFASDNLWPAIQQVFQLGQRFRERILDPGCDDGPLLRRVQGHQKIGGDLVRRPFANFPFVPADGCARPFASAMMESVVATDVLEHVVHDRLFVQEAWRRLAPTGTLFLTTPHSRFVGFQERKNHGAATAWGHRRGGYDKRAFPGWFPPGCLVEVVEWNEPFVPALYLVMRFLIGVASRASRALAHVCFLMDRHHSTGPSGHLLVHVRHGDHVATSAEPRQG